MSSFEEFQAEFFTIFSSNNFYEGKSYLEYVAQPQTNDEDNIVDTKIVLPLLLSLGFESGDIAKNTTANGKDNTRPDFQVKLTKSSIRCFLIEDKHTAYDLSKPEPLQQLISYAPSRGYELGLVCNGRLLLGWDLSNQSTPNPVLHLYIQQIVETYHGQNLFAAGKTGLNALTSEQIQDLKGLHRRFHKQNFENIENLIEEISKPENEWRNLAKCQSDTPNFDELLIADLKAAINLLEEDVLYQLELLLQEYDQYTQAKYLPNGNGNGSVDSEADETAPKVLTKLRDRILNYLRVSGLVELNDYAWADEKLIEFAETPRGSIQQLGEKFLSRLKQAEQKKETQQKKPRKAEETIQLDLLAPISEAKQRELGIKITPQPKITKLDPNLVKCLEEYERIVFDWKAWQAKQNLTHANAIKTQQYFISWRNLLTKTVLQGSNEHKLKEEFARQTAYVFVIRLLMVRICEDKGLIYRKFSDGGFKYWKEEVERRYLDLAQGVSMDYLLEMSYRSAQSIYAHFFNSADLFNWYRINTNTLIKVLHILNRFNLQQIDSDIIGMVYGRYVEEGKHEQGRYFTPKKVVEYILDGLGYTSDNPDIRDKKLLDLAGGSGSFLVHAARRLIDSYRSRKIKKIPIEYVPSIIQRVKDCLFCLDINPFACYLAETNLLIQVIDLLKQAKDAEKLQECSIDRFNVYNTDSLLLPKYQEIRTPLLNPILDLELSTVSQIKTKTGKFADGFDYVVGNPPYVRADEPGVDAYREQIVAQGRFETLYKKWDLYIPFIELGKNLLKAEDGKLGIIISHAYSFNTYAQLSRQMLCQELTITQIDFFEELQLFEDASVFNIILLAENRLPEPISITNRNWHSNATDLYSYSKQNRVIQTALSERLFRQEEAIVFNTNNTISLEDITYISVGMVLNSHERKYPNEFTKDDLISDIKDQTHPIKYLEGKDIERYTISRIRYLEYGHNLRVPSRIRRPTFPELYTNPKILRGETSFAILDHGWEQGDWIYCNHSVIIFVPWFELVDVANRSLNHDEAVAKSSISQKFNLAYLLAILNSTWTNNFLKSVTSSGRAGRFHPDDFRKLSIKTLSFAEQQPFIDRVDKLIDWNWEISQLNQLGDTIKFDYTDSEPVIKVNFLRVLNQLNPSCWNFLDAEPQRFEITGDRNQPIAKIKIKGDKLFNGRNELLYSNSLIVLQYLERYLPQYEKRGLTWTNLLTESKIPKKDEDIQKIFAECDRMTAEIRQKIEDVRYTYKELDEMVTHLYTNS